MPPLNARADVSGGTKGLPFFHSIHLHTYTLCTQDSKVLANLHNRAFVARHCDNVTVLAEMHIGTTEIYSPGNSTICLALYSIDHIIIYFTSCSLVIHPDNSFLLKLLFSVSLS